jgi:IS5 family transposase
MLQNLYDLSDIGAKYEVIDSRALFGYRKTRYKGQRKQNAKLHMMFALVNLYLADKRCLLA